MLSSSLDWYRPLHLVYTSSPPSIYKEKNGVDITTTKKNKSTKKSPQKLIYGLSLEGTVYLKR